jgi:hypothetical protein
MNTSDSPSRQLPKLGLPREKAPKAIGVTGTKRRAPDGFRAELLCSAELHPYASESWWTAPGARKKERRLQKAGLPSFANWRFFTLTIADRAISPLQAYLMGKGRIRRFLARLRTALGRKFLWCWKLEIHQDDGGYPHWHLLMEYKQRIPEEMLFEIERWWGLGRINVERVKAADIHYVFKYVAKGAEDIPEWVGRYKGRIRVFQASKGFYTQQQARTNGRKEPVSSLVPVDLFTRLESDKCKGVLVMTDLAGNKRVRTRKLQVTFNALLLLSANESIKRRVQLAPPGVVNMSQLESKGMI